MDYITLRQTVVLLETGLNLGLPEDDLELPEEDREPWPFEDLVAI